MKATRKKAKKADKKTVRVSDFALASSRFDPKAKKCELLAPSFPPCAEPPRADDIAMDSTINTSLMWMSSTLDGLVSEGQTFPGFPTLAILAQRAEYRRISETLATEMTRRWIELTASGDEDKTDKIQLIEGELRRMDVKGAFKVMAEQDGLYGRAHLFLDFDCGDDNREELKMNVGNGRNGTSRYKIKKGSFRAVRPVEAVWVYPQQYNTNNPLSSNFYRPEIWLVNNLEVHHSRLLRFVSREVPDLLKPTYAFGGLSMTQMARPYVENWLRTRQSVSDLIHSFSVSGVKTNLADTMLQGENEVYKRVDFFNQIRDNRGTLLLDNETEEFFNVSTPLSTLDKLQAQAQEHMAAVSGIPIVKLLGIQPAGLNADSEGELECFYTWVEAQQESLFREPLTRIISFIQMSLFGEVDEEITFKFCSLKTPSARDAAEVREIDARTGKTLIESGALTKAEERQRVAADPETPYDSLDTDIIPDLASDTKAAIAVQVAQAIVEAQGAGLLSDQAAMQELKLCSRVTGIFSSIQDSDIALADSEPTKASEMGGPMGPDGMPPAPGAPGAPPAGGGGQPGGPGGPAGGSPQRGDGAGPIGHDAAFDPDKHPRDDEGKFSVAGYLA